MASNAAYKGFTDLTAEIVENIRECEFFKSFPEKDLSFLLDICELVVIPEGEEIVTQGDVHSHLYFLTRGRVGIFINGERVSKLQRKGDLIGEINLHSQRPATNTLVTEMECEFLRFDVEKIRSLPFECEEYFVQNLYKYYAVMLTEKLEATNDKAKQFEIVIRQLQETQHALEMSNARLEGQVEKGTKELARKNEYLQGSHAKLEDLYNNREFTIKSLGKLHKNHLAPLKKVLMAFEKVEKNPTKQEFIKGAEEEVDKVIEILNPFSKLYISQDIIRGKKILILEKEKKMEALARLALGGTGLDFEFATEEKQAEKLLEGKDFHIVCLDSSWIPFAKKLHQKKPQIKMVLMASGENDQSVLHDCHFISNVIFRNPENRVLTIKYISTTVNKLVTQEIFGLEKYLNWGAEVQSMVVQGSNQRKSILQNIDGYFQEMGIRKRIREHIKSVSEELLMNMIYDAPVDKEGQSLYNHLSRCERIDLPSDQQGKIYFACDGLVAAVSAEDPFGALNKETILQYLESSGEGDFHKHREGKGGAGMGLFQILSLSDLVVFNIRKGHCTEVMALFYLDQQMTDSSNRPAFHFFADEE